MPANVTAQKLDPKYRMGHTSDVRLSGFKLDDAERKAFRDVHRFHYDAPNLEKETPNNKACLADIKYLYTHQSDIFTALNVALEAVIDEQYLDDAKKRIAFATIEMRLAAFHASIADARNKLKAQYADEDSDLRKDYLKAFDVVTATRARTLKKYLTKRVKELSDQEYYMLSVLKLVPQSQLNTAIDSGAFDIDNPSLVDLKVIKIPTTVINPNWCLGALGVSHDQDFFGTSQWMYDHGLTLGWGGYGLGWAGATKETCIYVTYNDETGETSFDIPDVPDGTPDRNLRIIADTFIQVLKAEGVTDIHFGSRNQRLLRFMAEASKANDIYMTFYLPAQTREGKDEVIPIERIIDMRKLDALVRRKRIKQSANPHKVGQDKYECQFFVQNHRKQVRDVMREDNPEEHFANRVSKA